MFIVSSATRSRPSHTVHIYINLKLFPLLPTFNHIIRLPPFDLLRPSSSMSPANLFCPSPSRWLIIPFRRILSLLPCLPSCMILSLLIAWRWWFDFIIVRVLIIVRILLLTASSSSMMLWWLLNDMFSRTCSSFESSRLFDIAND